jgi:hypothetical protein
VAEFEVMLLAVGTLARVTKVIEEAGEYFGLPSILMTV